MKTDLIPVVLIFILAFSSRTFAALGDRESELPKAFYARSTFEHYNRHVLSQPKLQLKQFASQGRVFAVTWNGKTHPDLRAVLGRHFSEYQAAYRKAKRTRRGHSPIEIELDGIHVEQGGTPRALYGRVWLTALFPPQVDKNEIR
jgi:hypothetical protein